MNSRDYKHSMIADLKIDIENYLLGKRKNHHEGKPRICVDFDGVINSYKSGFHPYIIPDPPLPGAIWWLRSLTYKYDVMIFSVRCNDEASIKTMIDWFKLHGLEQEFIDKLIFEPGKPSAKAYIDDRAIRFSGSFKSISDHLAIGMDPWYYPLPDWNRNQK